MIEQVCNAPIICICGPGYLVLIVRGFVYADVPAGGKHVRGCSRDLMVIIWAGDLSWHLIGNVPWYGGQDFVGDLASKMPCPAGKSADISGGFVSF